jgi:hypothetical protein
VWFEKIVWEMFGNIKMVSLSLCGNKTNTIMATGFPLRFNSENQKLSLIKLAKQNGRSANSHILYLIDRAVLSDSQKKERMELIGKSKK